jgi:nitroreductase
MQTWEAITSRRNVRTFTDRPVSAEHLDQMLEAGRRSPSSRNSQPWDFVLVTDRQQLQELAKVWVGAGHVAGSTGGHLTRLCTATTGDLRALCAGNS